MAEDFTPSPPAFNLYVSDAEGNIDFKDRSRSGGLWSNEKDGKVYYTGKINGKRLVMYPFTPRDKSESSDEPDW